MINLLKVLGLNFKTQKTFYWSNNRRYDFYLPKYNLIIETHGEQHYEEAFKNIQGSRTLKEEQENDKYKYKIAMNNSIDEYIVIDCRKSDINWIKKNIINSNLAEIFDLRNVDWESIDFKSRKSTHIEFLKLWNDGNSTEEISKETGSGKSTIINALNKFSKIGLCNYGKSI